MKKLGLVIFLLLGVLNAAAAVDENNSSYQPSKLSLKGGYYGEFIMHPGAYLGVDYAIYRKPWFDLHWDTEIGGYIHKWNNTSGFIQTSIGTRFTSTISTFVDLNVGVGYMLSAPQGEVYQVNEQGVLEASGRPVTSHAKPLTSLMLGWDGMRKKQIPLSVGVGLEAYWQTGFNHITLPHFAMRFGIRYYLNTKNEG